MKPVVTALVVGMAATASWAFKCEDDRAGNCSCTFSSEAAFSIHCPSFVPGETTFTVQFIPGRQAQLTCSNRQLTSFARQILPWLPGLKLGQVREVALVNCPLPEASLADVLVALGAAGVKFLTFRDGGANADGSGALAPFHLANLTDIVHLGLMRSGIPSLDQTFFSPALAASLTSLDLTGNKGIQLHVNAFITLANLKELKLMDCDLTSLSAGLFDPLVNLEILNLYSNKLVDLPTGLFKNLAKLKTLTLRNNKLENLAPDVLASLLSLEEVELGDSKLRGLPPAMLANNSRLKRFDFMINGPFCPPQRPGCEANALKLNLTGSLFANPSLEVVKMLHVPLVEVSTSLFQGCGNLRNVTIQSAYIDRLPAGLFAESPLVELIDLAGNRLTNITAGTFRGLANLKTLRLLANRIAAIEPAAFMGLTGLQVLHLHQNQLTEIGADLLRDLGRLDTLNLYQNQIRTIHPAALAANGRLRILDLAFNNLAFSEATIGGRFLSGQAFEALEVLNLTHNSIADLEESLLSNFLQLRVLNLSHNAFTALDPLDLAFIKNEHLIVDLSNNQIASLSLEATPEAVFIFNTSSTFSLLLAGNPLVCDCHLSELRQKVMQELVSVISERIRLADGDQLRCASPGELTGLLLAKVRYKQLLCPFPSPVLKDPCPNDCACAFNRYYDEVTLNCSSRGMTTFPERLPARATSSIWLHMENNSISDLAAAVRHFVNRTDTNYGNIRYLFLSNNKISKFRQDSLPPDLKVLWLDHNQIQHFQQTDINYFDGLVNRTSLRLRLGNNPYSCSCDSKELYHFIKDRGSNVEDKVEVEVDCQPDDLILARIEPVDFCTQLPSPGIIVVIAIFILLLIVLLVMSLLYACYRDTLLVWIYSMPVVKIFFPEELIDADKPYDAFVSYSHFDRAYVNDVLVPGLEQPDNPEYKYRCLIHERDWHAGEMIPDQIIDSVQSSRRTIILLTKDYIESMWSKLEFRAAHSQALADRTQRVIIIVHGELPPKSEMEEDLRKYISMNTYLESGDPWFWHKLRYAMPHKGGLWTKRKRTRRETDRLELIRTQAELELSKNGTATSSPATISITSLIKDAAAASGADAQLNGKLGPAAAAVSNGTVPSKQLLTDEYMAQVLGGRNGRGGPLKAEGGRAVRQVLSNKV